MKKIAVGDLGEFWYGDYKEPFEQLEGAVPGHPVGVVLKADDGKLLCAWCGKTYDNLGRHVSGTHGTPAAAYKRDIGLLQKSALVSEKTRQAMVRRAVTSSRGDAARMTDIRQMRKPGWTARRLNGNRTPEKLNLTGRCYVQLLAVGKSVMREDGKVTQGGLRRRGINQSTLLPYWPDLVAYRHAVGDFRAATHHWTASELIDTLRQLATQLGRTPAVSDLRRYGLAGQRVYRKHFGAYAEACRRAGLDPNLPIPRDDEFDNRVLTSYATLGSAKNVAAFLRCDEDAVRTVMHRFGYPYPAGYSGPGRREWAAEMARRLAGVPEQAVA